MNGPVSLHRYIGCEGLSRVGAGRLRNPVAVPAGVQSNPFPGAAVCQDVSAVQCHLCMGWHNWKRLRGLWPMG